MCTILVLSRKEGESIVLSNNIVVTVVSIERGKVRLGVLAPKTTPVHRKEVQDAIDEERRKSEFGTIPN